ncbi:MAG: hypothetical protein PHS41_10340 [Victivallaceae bacterium]|nr:hypothetical protein [Victivallaceae bacterium]
MNKTLILGAAASAMLLAGCGTTTTIYDPAATKTGIRQSGSVSSEEFREVAVAAVRGAMTNVKFTSFLKRYQREMKDPDAIPVLKLDRVINDTDDPDLNVSELTDMLNEELLNAGKVDVTMAEGAGRTKAIGASRKLQDDDNFDQKTVAQEGTLQAARLVLRPKVVSNEVRDGGRKAVTRTFVLEMADIKTGLIMWKFTKQLGFMKEKGTLGW